VKHWVKATGKFPVVVEDDMLRKTINESSEPLVGSLGREKSGTARASRINRRAAKSGCAGEWGAWGQLSGDGRDNITRLERGPLG
jgi:hypothetical protein